MMNANITAKVFFFLGIGANETMINPAVDIIKGKNCKIILVHYTSYCD